MGWWPCGGCLDACEHCDGGYVPNVWKVVIAGLANNGGCTNCPTYNATYLVPVVRGLECRSYLFHDFDCFTSAAFDDGVYVGVDLVAGNYVITVRLVFQVSAGNQETITYLKNYGATKPDCLNLTDEDIPYSSSLLFSCDAATASTCTLTAM